MRLLIFYHMLDILIFSQYLHYLWHPEVMGIAEKYFLPILKLKTRNGKGLMIWMAIKQNTLLHQKEHKNYVWYHPGIKRPNPSTEDESFNQNYEYYWIYKLLMNAKKVCFIFNKEF